MIGIAKTIKLFIGGAFPRTESGRSFKVYYNNSDKVYGHLCLASRKDFRSAVEAAEKGHKDWQTKTAFNKSQILYRMAEMMEGKRLEFVNMLEMINGLDSQEANKQVDAGIESFVYFAGFCDKYLQLSSNLNPINGPYANYSAPEPVGVVSLFASNELHLGNLCANISSIVTSGNAVIVLLDTLHACPALLAPLAEVFATSDLPGGVINILSGSHQELAEYVGSHMAVRAVSIQTETTELIHQIKSLSVGNLKRIVTRRPNPNSLEAILDTTEMKTVWQPMGF